MKFHFEATFQILYNQYIFFSFANTLIWFSQQPKLNPIDTKAENYFYKNKKPPCSLRSLWGLIKVAGITELYEFDHILALTDYNSNQWFPPLSAKLYLQNSTLRLPQEPPRSLPRPTISDHNLFSPLPTHSPLPQPPHPPTPRTLYPLRDNSMSNDPVAYPNIRFYIFFSSGIFLIPCSCCHIYPSMIDWWPITIIFIPIIDFAAFFS